MTKEKLRTVRTAAAALTLMLTALIITPPQPASAAARYTPVAGGMTTFDKYLIIRAGTQVPHASFSFKAVPGQGQPAASDRPEVLPGIGSPSVSDALFAPEDPVNPQENGGGQYALQKVTADFSDISFDEPGIYRYVLTEEPSDSDAAAGLMHDEDANRTLDVYVTDDGSGALEVSSYVLYAGGGTDPGEKSDGMTNEYRSGDLIFKHEVTGNQASRDKYFDFTLTLKSLTPGDVFTVSIADDGDPDTADGSADPVTGTSSATRKENAGRENVTALTADENGQITEHFFLRHGQSIAVRGLPQNASYSLTEDPEDYEAEESAVEGFTDKVTGTVGTGKKTSYRNAREAAVPTGVAAAILPGAVLSAASLAGLLLSVRRRRNAA